ncbi:uncharacterized protein EI90DRAFT_2478396 [Cantharellus anzutake]|uniref:uncharacterized protein n=1 Tax=Cantharellus anzutake TaxID=1750568 RepID=UPI0019051CD6|nr:uncharacterized protein EI90DRAFT_2478396 [Cantharellus anzutake]KAF8322815.1 hypothetical protein EI90DRAFT_2478396 [Cantharellus anzutake]
MTVGLKFIKDPSKATIVEAYRAGRTTVIAAARLNLGLDPTPAYPSGVPKGIRRKLTRSLCRHSVTAATPVRVIPPSPYFPTTLPPIPHPLKADHRTSCHRLAGKTVVVPDYQGRFSKPKPFLLHFINNLAIILHPKKQDSQSAHLPLFSKLRDPASRISARLSSQSLQ